MSDECAELGVRGEFRLTGLDCPDCARGVAASVEGLDGVLCASLNFATGMLIVEAHDQGSFPGVVSLVRSMDYGVEPLSGTHGIEVPAISLRSRLVEPAVALAGVLLLAGALLDQLDVAPGLSLATSLVAIALCGVPVFRRAAVAARNRVLDMNVLMSVAVIGALALGEHREAATVVFLFAIGGALESRALARTRRSIRELVSLTPEVAVLLSPDGPVQVRLDELVPGQVVLVKPGERLPVDGEVTAGSSAVNEAPITGESLPVHKESGAHVWAGSLNGSGALEVRVTSSGEDSTLARIVRLVEDAQAEKAPIEGLVDRFTRWYTPAVVGLAAALAVVPPIVIWLATGVFAPQEWIYRALVLLVVSCPCALVISTPVAVVSAITRAARDGVLVKGGAFIEMAAKVRVVAFDKTGTLTIGRPEVVSVLPRPGQSAEELLEIAAALEARSTHPLAAAVLAAASDAPLAALDEFEEIPGHGVSGTLDGNRYVVGSPAFVRDSGVDIRPFEFQIEELELEGRSVIAVASRDSSAALGVLGVADVVRDGASGVMSALRAGGIEHTVMLTGDNARVGEAVAAQSGVDEVRARLLPQDKSEAVSQLSAKYGALAMVGDGINDAPALAVADIGIAMGAAGSDTALETADVALMSDHLEALPGFFDLGKRTVANIQQNVWFSIVVKFAVLGLAMAGKASLWLAVFADTGVALLVILNGLRLLRPRKIDRASVR